MEKIIELTLITAAIAVLANLITWYLPLASTIRKKLKIDRKPFSCPVCLSFWLILLFTLCTSQPITYVLTLPLIGFYLAQVVYLNLSKF